MRTLQNHHEDFYIFHLVNHQDGTNFDPSSRGGKRMSWSLTLDSPILSLKNWLNPNLHRFSHRTSRFHSKTKVSCQIFPLHSSLPASGSGCEWRCETCPLAARPRGEISDQTQIPDESNTPDIYLGKLQRPHCDLTGILVSKGKYPNMVLFQVSELL